MEYQPIALHRFFFAARPSGSITGRIEQEALRRAGNVRRVRADHYHVTLAITDDYSCAPAGLPHRLCEAGATVVAAPFRLVLDRVAGTHRSVALRPSRPIAPLKQLQQAIVAAMAGKGIRQREGYRFSPHMTLFYRDGQPSSQLIGGFAWLVDEFVLIDSHVGRSYHVKYSDGGRCAGPASRNTGCSRPTSKFTSTKKAARGRLFNVIGRKKMGPGSGAGQQIF